VPFDIRLDRLHLTIQAAMGWSNCHLYELRLGDAGWSTPWPDNDWADHTLDARKTLLSDILSDIGIEKLTYLYDFGDDWQHTITVERLADAEILKATKDPSHDYYAEISEWIGDDFDPGAVDAKRLTANVARLAKAWSYKPPVKPARRR
jgi:hypothetical protein